MKPEDESVEPLQYEPKKQNSLASSQLDPADPQEPTQVPHSMDNQPKNDQDNGESELTWTEISPGRPIPPEPAPQKDYEVKFLENDPDFPNEWSASEKTVIIFVCAMSAVVVAWGSAVISGGVAEIEEQFHVGGVVGALNISLYVVGFAVGPVLWGPLSELIGRRIPLLIGLFGFMLFCFACATAKDYQTVMLSRFFMGTIGAASITIGPAIAADTFGSLERGRAIGIVSLMIMAGPMVAPVVGGYISASYLGWRWTQYITGIFAALVLVLVFLLLKETYHPKILAVRAAVIRHETGNWAIFAPLEKADLDMQAIFQRTIAKPLAMLVFEPILLLISLYHGLVYGILYLCLEAVPLVFTNYGWKGGNVFLPYLSMLVGSIISCMLNLVFFEPLYVKRLKQSGKPVVPEERMPLMMMGGVAFPVGIFLFCWSGAYFVHWIVPTIGLGFIGFGLVAIFMAAFNYIIDCYLTLAASGIAANTFVRSGMGAAFPLFAAIMFRNLGTQWAGTLLGCLAAILIPVPFLFYIFGGKIRALSKYALNLDDMEQTTRKLSRTSTSRSHTSRASRGSRRPSMLAV